MGIARSVLAGLDNRIVCRNKSRATLGTPSCSSATSPGISGDATTGLYTASAAKVDVAIAGTKTVEIGTSSMAPTQAL